MLLPLQLKNEFIQLKTQYEEARKQVLAEAEAKVSGDLRTHTRTHTRSLVRVCTVACSHAPSLKDGVCVMRDTRVHACRARVALLSRLPFVQRCSLPSSAHTRR